MVSLVLYVCNTSHKWVRCFVALQHSPTNLKQRFNGLETPVKITEGITMKCAFVCILTILLCWSAVPSAGQASNHKIPTAAQVAVQKKPVNKKGVMRGTTNTDRWAAATKHADHRATALRTEQKVVKP